MSNPVGATLGLQPAAEVVITNANSAVSFSAQSYRQSENVPGGAAVIPIVRIGNPFSTVTVTVYTGTNGSAAPGVDYIPTSNMLVFYPGVMTNLFLVPLLNNTNMLSDQTVDLELSNPVGGFLADAQPGHADHCHRLCRPRRRQLRPAQLYRQRGGADGADQPAFGPTA